MARPSATRFVATCQVVSNHRFVALASPHNGHSYCGSQRGSQPTHAFQQTLFIDCAARTSLHPSLVHQRATRAHHRPLSYNNPRIMIVTCPRDSSSSTDTVGTLAAILAAALNDYGQSCGCDTRIRTHSSNITHYQDFHSAKTSRRGKSSLYIVYAILSSAQEG
ncbi:hypothetical protein BD311DRAFT_760252 [Dichomitus squalens]|uniref:Uncharacterized protein n=1 Tax=Dichomitus squalens TaxID=114155 RepID=A0A4Q9MMX3_9APHY|nr:hypothetical protein BD311DRAFT_760252 [Dichomitus squalens]